MDANPTPPAAGRGAAAKKAGCRRTGVVHKELSAVLARVHPRLRPWHLYGLLGACIVAAVLSAVLVTVRDHQQRSAALAESQANVRFFFLALSFS